MATEETKTRILDAAERLFSEHGFNGTSLRDLTRLAAVNIAAVHYHFGSKEAVLTAVLDRIVGPTNHERLARLAQAEEEAGDDPPSVEAILEAFIAPDLRLIRDLGERGRVVARFLGRSRTEPLAVVQQMTRHQFAELGQRFLEALERALPEVPRARLSERLHWLVGILTYILADTPPASTGTDPTDTDALTARLVAFAAAGMRTPPTEARAGDRP